MMGGIFSWLIIGVVLYFMFSKRGGMVGCCGGHNHHAPEHSDRSRPRSGRSPVSHDEIIDLKKEDYSVREEK
jgi:hypothetical protein